MLICEVLNFALLHSQLLWKPTYLSLGISKLWSFKQTGFLAQFLGTRDFRTFIEFVEKICYTKSILLELVQSIQLRWILSLNYSSDKKA